MTPFLANLVLFSPLLAIAALALYILDRADHLRRGAGLIPQLEPARVPGEEGDEEYEEYEYNEGEEEEEEEEYDDGAEGPPELVDPPLYPADDGGAPHPHPHPPQPPPLTPRTRTVGTKKARSLATRDQRRAYHEFQRSQQEERKRALEATAAAREELIFAEKCRRALAEDEIDERVRAARAARAAEERTAEERHRRDVHSLKGLVGGEEGEEGRAWELGALAAGVGGGRGVDWVRRVLRAEGLVGMRAGGVCGVLTEGGWYVRVGAREMGMLYRELESRGRMEWGEMAGVLESTLRL